MENIKINLKATGFEMTESIADYVIKRVTNLGKLLSATNTDVLVEFEVAKTTNHHHNASDLFRAECMVKFNGQSYRATSKESDLYVAIDTVKDTIFNEITKNKNRSRNLFIRSARKLKEKIKGWSN